MAVLSSTPDRLSSSPPARGTGVVRLAGLARYVREIWRVVANGLNACLGCACKQPLAKEETNMATPKPSTTADEYGLLIDVSAQIRGSRGASKVFMEGLLALLRSLTLGDQACVVMHPDYCIARTDFPGTDAGEDACKNARQALGARLKSHHEELMRRGDLPDKTRLSINWAPDGATTPEGVDIGNRPQCSLVKKV